MTELLTDVEAGVGTLTLNRPSRINALSRAMIDQITAQLRAWLDDDRVEQVALRGAGERGFCAGADVRQMRDAIQAGRTDLALDFLFAEYELNQLIAGYPKPVTAHLVGISMGGGLGLGMHNTTRIGSPNTRWAMPEVGIGLWPDVGVCYELSRTPGRIGEHLAMTGAPIDGASALWAGLLDQCPGAQPAESWLAAGAGWIDDCYSGDDPVVIVRALAGHPDPAAQAAAETIRSRSPLSVAVALEAVRRARDLPDVAAVLEQDRVLARTTMADPAEFVEGVRAQLVDRDNQPRWRHARVEDVQPAEVAARFDTGDQQPGAVGER